MIYYKTLKHSMSRSESIMKD